MFSRARQNRVFQDVVDQVQKAIVDGTLSAGEKLPAERELKETFGVSRGTLREALRVLEQKGLIEIRLGVGGGAFVKSASIQPVSESLALLLGSRKATSRDLSEFRKDLESSMARLAARRAGPADVDRLKALLSEMSRHLSPVLDSRAVLEVDSSIHRELARITRNPVYRVVQETIQDNIRHYYDEYVPRDIDTLTFNHADLCRLVAAIEQADPEAAGDCMVQHLSRYDAYIKTSR